MIQLHTDCLVFETADGAVACSAKTVAIELAGEMAGKLDPQLLQDASAAVLHYFKAELGRDHVSVGEFAEALVKVLRSLGVHVVVEESSVQTLPAANMDGQPAVPGEAAVAAGKILESDLAVLAVECGQCYELLFFSRLKEEMTSRLRETPRLLRFVGLRPCAKLLAGTSRWTPKCEQLSDQIVAFLRDCMQEQAFSGGCALVVL